MSRTFTQIDLILPCCSEVIQRRVEYTEGEEGSIISSIQKVPQKCKACGYTFGEEEQDALRHQLHEAIRDSVEEFAEEIDESLADRFVMKHPDQMEIP